MNNEEILKTLTEESGNSESEENKNVTVPLVKFLVFSVEDKQFAVPAETIKEIVLDLPVYFVPFVPSYVRGFINRHGEPCTVIDLHLLFEQKLLDASTFLVLSDKSNPAAFLISDVVQILKVEESAISSLAASQSGDLYISGSVNAGDGREILILSFTEIFKRLERDLE